MEILIKYSIRYFTDIEFFTYINCVDTTVDFSFTNEKLICPKLEIIR